MLKKILKTVVPFLILAGSMAGAYTLTVSAPEVEQRNPERWVPQVAVMSVQRQSVQLCVETYGTVRPRTEIALMPQVSGRVVELSPALKDGAFFAKDQLLARIEPRDFELALTQAEASVARAKAALQREQAEAEIARQEWEEYGQGEPNDLVMRKPQLAEALAALASAEAVAEQAELNLERTEILAPFDGRVRSEQVDVGQFIAAGNTIASVYATDYVEVRLEIPDDQLAFLDLPLTRSMEIPCGAEAGAPPPKVRLSAPLGSMEVCWDGAIVRTEGEVDPRTRVIRALARVHDPFQLENPAHPPLLVGMYAKGIIIGRRIDDLVVLPRELLHSGDRVYLVGNAGQLIFREVEVLKREKQRVIVSGGLEEGELICLTDLHPAIEGMQLEVAPESGPIAAEGQAR